MSISFRFITWVEVQVHNRNSKSPQRQIHYRPRALYRAMHAREPVVIGLTSKESPVSFHSAVQTFNDRLQVTSEKWRTINIALLFSSILFTWGKGSFRFRCHHSVWENHRTYCQGENYDSKSFRRTEPGCTLASVGCYGRVLIVSGVTILRFNFEIMDPSPVDIITEIRLG